nr:uracil-DNA glycosylase [Massilia arenosa]
MSIPTIFTDAFAKADPSWHPVLRRALASMSPDYLAQLAQDHFLPTQNRLFAAFVLPLEQTKYVLVGEGPYPREESASGVCFMDAAVGELWCDAGLSKPVNRATSLRNFMKMLLVTAGYLDPQDTNGEAMAAAVARLRAATSIRTLPELQANLIGHGFLLLNASLVFRSNVAPAIDARAWLPFLETVLDALANVSPPPKLVLWGRIAEQLKKLKGSERFGHLVSEHPFNVSFIHHDGMKELFGPMKLLEKSR